MAVLLDVDDISCSASFVCQSLDAPTVLSWSACHSPDTLLPRMRNV